MRQFILVLFTILLINSCGETEIAEKTNPYKGVKIQKESKYKLLREKFGEPVYFKTPDEVSTVTFNRDGKVIEIVSYDSNGKALDVSEDGSYGIEIIKYDEMGRKHIVQKKYLNGKQYRRWEYEYTEFDSLKSVTHFNNNDELDVRWEHLYDALKRKIENNENDADNTLKRKSKLHYLGQSIFYTKVIDYNKWGDETSRNEYKYTWFDAESINVATKQISNIDRNNYITEIFNTYDSLGNETESKKSQYLKDGDFRIEDLTTTSYDSTGKKINFLYHSRFLTLETDFKLISKTVYEYEYYDDEG